MRFWSNLVNLVSTPFRALLSAPLRLVSAPRRLAGLSLPARIGVLLAVFLLIVTITDLVLYQFYEKRADWSQKLWYLPVELVLCLVIPWIAYQALKQWLGGRPSRFPDIDAAWKAGVAMLEERGLDLSSLPLFLVVGVHDQNQSQALFRASGLSSVGGQTPTGPAALHWLVDERGIFLVTTGASQLARLAQAVQSAPQPVAPAQNPGLLRQTVAAGQLRQSAVFTSPAESPAPPAVDLRGTMELSSLATDGGPRAPAGPSRRMTREEGDLQQARLAYVCDLLRRAREPVCPLNGILTVLPFDLLQRGASEAVEVRTAAQADMRVVRDTTRLRCPVVTLVAGMETEAGFREMLRRVGFDRAKAQRFGKGYGVWNPPTAEQLEALAAHACGAFEDCVYELFRSKDGHSKPGNTKLYSLLCKTRGDFKERLQNVLVNTFAMDADKRAADPEPLLFGGCYFAATGDNEDRQGFVRSVFEKLMAEDIELQWTSAALAEDDRCRRWAVLGMTLSGTVAVLLLVLLIWRIFLK